MFSRRPLCALALVVTASLLSAGAARAQEQIRTVNPARIFNEMQETVDLQNAMKNRNQQIEQMSAAKQNELKEMEKNVKLFNVGTAEYNAANDKLINAAVNYRAWVEITKNSQANEFKAQMIRLFGKIEVATKEVAEAEKADLVIVEQKLDLNADQLGQATAEQVRALINQRNTMYSSGKLDITQKVLDKVNANYKSQK